MSDEIRTGADGSWNIGEPIKVIETPAGDYVPESDNLVKELVAAAKSAGLDTFYVFLNGHMYANPEELPTNSIAALTVQAKIEGVATTAEVVPDTKGA